MYDRKKLSYLFKALDIFAKIFFDNMLNIFEIRNFSKKSFRNSKCFLSHLTTYRNKNTIHCCALFLSILLSLCKKNFPTGLGCPVTSQSGSFPDPKVNKLELLSKVGRN